MNYLLQKLFKMAAVAVGLSACAPVPTTTIIFPRTSIVPATPLEPLRRGNVVIGPGTRHTYDLGVFDALGAQAGKPIAILSSDDFNLLQNQDNIFDAIHQIQSWLGPRFRLPDYELGIIYDALKDGANDTTVPIYPSNRGHHSLEAAVIVIPGAAFSADYFRGQSNLNFRDGIFDNEALKEGALFVAGHEASHVRLLSHGNNSEMGAEMGAYSFIREYPEFFPMFKSLRVSEAFLAGERAFWTLLTGGQGEYKDDTVVDYMMIPFCSASAHNCPSTESRPRLDNAQLDFMRKLAVEMFPSMTDTEAARKYLQKRLRDTETATICMNGKSRCEQPKAVTDPSNRFLVRVVGAIRRLHIQGSFNNNLDEQIFARHILAGAELYLEREPVHSPKRRLSALPSFYPVLVSRM